MVTSSDLAIDRELVAISQSFSFLVDLTPVNVDDARAEFLADPGHPPRFAYRPLEDLPTVISARLKDVDVTRADDATLGHLFAAKKKELELQVAMLSARDTDDFLPLSIELYGSVSPGLEAIAEDILELVPPERSSRGRCLGAEAFARKARAELSHYRDVIEGAAGDVRIRPDTSGVMVAEGNLLIAESASVASSRVTSLLAHEIGTHILTYANGARQPLKLMAAGLAGYEETQEGLALVAEAMVGGLTGKRLRQIAARVIAVKRRLQNQPFEDVHSELVERLGYSPGGGFTIAMRVFRSGGLTKDAVYLRGLQDLVEYVSTGQGLDQLWVGKLALTDLPLIRDLRDRRILHAPAALPRFFDDPAVRRRVEAIAVNEGLHQLIGAET